MSIATMVVIWIVTCAVLGNRRIQPPQWEFFAVCAMLVCSYLTGVMANVA